jgi:hypothetical protein
VSHRFERARAEAELSPRSVESATTRAEERNMIGANAGICAVRGGRRELNGNRRGVLEENPL